MTLTELHLVVWLMEWLTKRMLMERFMVDEANGTAHGDEAKGIAHD